MKQLWQNISTGKASIAEVPAPVAGPGQILVRVMASLISAGTERSVVEFAEKNIMEKAIARPDLVKQIVQKARRDGWLSTFEAARNRLETEMVLGYSNAGVVIEVGEGAGVFKVGDKVACAGGGFASHSEIVRIPRNLAAIIPQGAGLLEIPFEAAAFATVAAIAMQGLRLAELQIGEVVAVIGLGLIGQITVQLASANGCIVVGMDPNLDRCRLAERFGCAATAQSDEEMAAITLNRSEGRGADAVLIAAATSSDGPVSLAAEIARDRARVVAVGAVGLKLPRKPYYMKELDFRVSRSYGPGRYDSEYEEKGRDYPAGYVRWTEGRNIGSILQLLAAGRLSFSPLITHRFPIEQADRGYELIAGKTGEPSLGVIITYAQEPSLERRVELTRPDASSAPGARELCVGVIGAGNFATAALLPAMKRAGGIRFGGICSAGGTSARSAGVRYGFRYCASDEAELFDDPEIDTIVVCTRHSSHARLVVAGLQAGKHVFCEKPLATDEQQLTSILRVYTSRSQRQLLAVGYNRRFAPLARQLKEFVGGSTEPFVMHYRINAGFIPSEHWTQDREIGGGRVIGEVCHFVDFLSFICGHPVSSVFASIMPNTGRYSDDNLSALLMFADGSIGTVTYSANGDKSFSKERIEVYVQGKVGVLDDFRDLRTAYGGKCHTSRLRLRADKGHRSEWAAFRDAICNGTPAPISFEELLNSTLGTFALLRSHSTGTRIDIDLNRFITRALNEHTAGAAEECF